MTTTLGKFREDINAFSTGVIVKSDKLLFSKSGDIVIWHFAIRDKTRGLIRCRMFLRPRDVIYMADMVGKTVTVQGSTIDFHESCHVSVMGLKVIDQED